MNLKTLPDNVFARVFHFDADKIDAQQLQNSLLDSSNSNRNFDVEIGFVEPARVNKKTKYLTICELYSRKTGGLVLSATAACHPGDTPNRKLGYQIAWNRAVDKISEMDYE